MDLVSQVLSERGPCLSTELARILVDDYGLSSGAARQRISRSGASVKRLAYLTFPRNARFTYLQKDYGSPWFWERLIEALMHSSPAYGCALASIAARGGLVPVSHFRIASGAPLAQTRHLSPEVILSRLKTANVLEDVDVPGLGICIARKQDERFYEDAIPAMQARLVAERILLLALRTWIRNLGLGSYDKVALRDEQTDLPRVGTFAWDLTAPSYVSPMVSWTPAGKLQQGFIACDVLLTEEVVSEVSLKPFIQKCETLRSLKRVGKCLQIFVAQKYSPEAFQLGKASGIVPATVETLFGEQVADALVQLSSTIERAARGAINASEFHQLFETLGKIEGAAINLRGALFEYVVAELMRQHLGGRVKLNRIFRDAAGNKAEVDVLGVAGSHTVHFIECKGYQPSTDVDDADVDKWLNVRIPLVRQAAMRAAEWQGHDLHFELWTTGTLTAASKQKIDKVKSTVRPSKYTLDYREGNDVMKFARQIRDRALIDTLEQHFLNHPLSDRKVLSRKNKSGKLKSPASKVVII